MPPCRSPRSTLNRALIALTLGVISCTTADVAGPSRNLGVSLSKASTVPSTTGFDMIDLGNLGVASTFANAINPSGDVVGSGTRTDGTQRAFLWRNGTMIDLGTLGGGWSEATGISPSGEVAGTSETLEPTAHAFTWRDGTMRDLGTLGGLGPESVSSAAGINASGAVVGLSITSGHSATAVLWTRKGEVVDLGSLAGDYSTAAAIDASGAVVGATDSPDGEVAFVWKNGIMRSLGSLGGFSWARAVAEGYVAGTSRTAPTGHAHAFLWSKGVMRDLGTLGGANSNATGVNASGWVVGESELATTEYISHAFLWRDGHMIDLGMLPGDLWSEATAISPTGRIVGNSYGPTAVHAVMWIPK